MPVVPCVVVVYVMVTASPSMSALYAAVAMVIGYELFRFFADHPSPFACRQNLLVSVGGSSGELKEDLAEGRRTLREDMVVDCS